MGGGELRILKERERGSHRSFQVSIEEPLPTFHRQPFLGIALPATMLGQARDTARSIPEGRIMEIFPVWGAALGCCALGHSSPPPPGPRTLQESPTLFGQESKIKGMDIPKAKPSTFVWFHVQFKI